MKRYELIKKNYIEDKLLVDDIFISKITETNEDCELIMNSLINLFNSEYVWDSMFTVEDVKYRLNIGHILFILYYKSTPIGYFWFREVDKTTCFSYNLYVTKKIQRPKIAAYFFVRNTWDTMLKNYEKIECECDDWNWAILDIIKKIGAQEKNK